MTLGTSAFAAFDRVTVYVGGEKIKSDVTARVVNERTMLPLRAVFEAIGAEVGYDGATQTITATKGDTVVKLVVGSKVMTVNDEEIELDVAPYIEKDRTLVPVRACAEAFKLKVDWFGDVNTVRVRKEVDVIESITKGEAFAKMTYNENGNDSLLETGNGAWKKYIYDENENLQYWEDSNGEYERFTYNNFGDVIKEEINKDGMQCTMLCEYDENGNEIYRGIEGYNDWAKTEFDDRNNPVYEEFADGSWTKAQYDDDNNLTYIEYSDGTWTKVEYDDAGNETDAEFSDGFWQKTTYDENGNETYVEFSDGDWRKFEYDDAGNLVFESNSGGAWEKFTYDENGRLRKTEDSENRVATYITVIK